MKRFLTLLLAVAMVLSFAACGDNGTTIRNENEEDNVKKDPIAAQYLQDLAVKTAAYPELPAMPNETELDEAFSTIDYDKMGADGLRKGAGEDLGGLGRAQQRSITMRSSALQQRGNGATPTPFLALHASRRRARCSPAEDNTVRLAREPLPRALRCSARRRTATAARSFYRSWALTIPPRRALRATMSGATSTARPRRERRSSRSSVWLNENVPYNEETLQVLAEQYLASTFSAPMGDGKTDKAIGEWINENTGNLLQDAAGEHPDKARDR